MLCLSPSSIIQTSQINGNPYCYQQKVIYWKITQYLDQLVSLDKYVLEKLLVVKLQLWLIRKSKTSLNHLGFLHMFLQYFLLFGPQLLVKIGNVRWYEPPSFLHPVTVCPTSTHWAVPVKCMCSTVYKLQTNSKFRSGWTILSIIMGNHASLILLVTSFVDFVSLRSCIQ